MINENNSKILLDVLKDIMKDTDDQLNSNNNKLLKDIKDPVQRKKFISIMDRMNAAKKSNDTTVVLGLVEELQKITLHANN